MTERTCADCAHEEGYHDPCSKCAGQGRTCRIFATEKTKRGASKRPSAKRRR